MRILNLKNDFNFNLEDLFCIGKRVNNPKRNFLFISKLLGKHIPVVPDVCKVAGRLLASLYYPQIDSRPLVNYIKHPIQYDREIKLLLDRSISTDRNTLVVGFAETATGLGMSVASCIRNCVYYSTTRDIFDDKKFLFSFEEVHSHATLHVCYDCLNESFSSFDEIILVDDEITTGNSMLQLIKQLHCLSGVKRYRILTLLDWRSKENKDKFETLQLQEQFDIKVFSLISGNIMTEDNTVFQEEVTNSLFLPEKNFSSLSVGFPRIKCTSNKGVHEYYYKNSGRFGVRQSDIQQIEHFAKIAASEIKKKFLSNFKGKRILVLSEGEDIFIPSRIASYLSDDMEVFFKTNTRSPIYCDGSIIKEKHKYIGHNQVEYYLYNKSEIEKSYDLTIFIGEFPPNVQLTSNVISVLLDSCNC